MADRVPYLTFGNAPAALHPWMGRRLAFLTIRGDLDAAVMARILDALDRAADFYARVTGREPEPSRQHEGRTTIAEVAGIGGAAWAWLGQTGIEIQPEYFDVLYSAARDRGELDQPLFYELGRNYWFYEKQLDLHPGSVATGWAVYMRFLSMEHAGVKGAPYRGWPFAEFRERVFSMLDHFAARTDGLAWETLFAEPPVHVQTFEQRGRESLGLSTADLIAALLHRLGGKDPESFMKAFLAAATTKVPRMPDLPLKSRERGLAICANILHAASLAAGRDLRDEFRRWRWPVAGAAIS